MHDEGGVQQLEGGGGLPQRRLGGLLVLPVAATRGAACRADAAQ
ncbi:hypothetical protein [Microbacterium lacticum]|nr:hypothetical protein [Microbacterium lacticum]